MKHSRRSLLAGGVATLAAGSRMAWGQTYPVRPVRLIVGAAAGSAPDINARLVAQWLSERFGQPFVVENRPGAATDIGTEVVVRASPDGYTLLLITLANAVNAALYENLNFDFLRDIAPVASINREPLAMLVRPSFPAETVPEFISYAKANPGRLTMGSPGIGTSPYMAGELFKFMTGIDRSPRRRGADHVRSLAGVARLHQSWHAPGAGCNHGNALVGPAGCPDRG